MLDVFNSMSKFALNDDYKRELERDLCPVLKRDPNLKIEGNKPAEEKTDKKRPKQADTTGQDLYKVTGIRVKGHPLVKEPFQRDAWNVLSNKYYQHTKIDVTKIFGKDAEFKSGGRAKH